MWKSLLVITTAVLLCLGAASKPPAGSKQPKLSAAEEKFSNLLSNCILNGRWCTTSKGKLDEEYQEKYTIQGATKTAEDRWTIHAHIEFAGKSLTVPIPVRLRWAGDTPVITLDKVSVPGFGVYSGRVLIFENTYAGTWSVKDRGGMLHGMIEKGPVPALRSR